MDIYFAHSLKDYGKQRSRDAKAAILQKWPDATIHDPEDFEHEFKIHANVYGWHSAYIAVVKSHIKSSDAIMVVLEHGSKIGKGVFCEIVAAQSIPVEIFALRDGVFKKVRKTMVCNHDDWVKYATLVVDE